MKTYLKSLVFALIGLTSLQSFALNFRLVSCKGKSSHAIYNKVELYTELDSNSKPTGNLTIKFQSSLSSGEITSPVGEMISTPVGIKYPFNVSQESTSYLFVSGEKRPDITVLIEPVDKENTFGTLVEVLKCDPWTSVPRK